MSACPCKNGEPCGPRCACVMSHSSHGCRHCCSYGSDAVRRARAKYLAGLGAAAEERDRLAAELAGVKADRDRLLEEVARLNGVCDTNEALLAWQDGREVDLGAALGRLRAAARRLLDAAGRYPSAGVWLREELKSLRGECR